MSRCPGKALNAVTGNPNPAHAQSSPERLAHAAVENIRN